MEMTPQIVSACQCAFHNSTYPDGDIDIKRLTFLGDIGIQQIKAYSLGNILQHEQSNQPKNLFWGFTAKQSQTQYDDYFYQTCFDPGESKFCWIRVFLFNIEENNVLPFI